MIEVLRPSVCSPFTYDKSNLRNAGRVIFGILVSSVNALEATPELLQLLCKIKVYEEVMINEI